MSSYTLSQVRNFRSCNAGIPQSLEMDAIIETITEGWDYGCVETTAFKGVADTDRDAIRELIKAEELTVTQQDAEAALWGWCRGKVDKQQTACLTED